MPIYEYVCPRCKAKFELLRPMRQAGEKGECPQCKQPAEPVPSHYACYTRDGGGASAPVGGSSCSGCSASSCDSCGS